MSRYQLLSVAEAAEQIKRKRWFIYKEIELGHIAVCKIGGQLAIRQADLDEYVARSRRPALGEKKSKIVFGEVSLK